MEPVATHKNNRRSRRIPYMGPIRIAWEDNGQQRFAMAKCIDLSAEGLRIEVPQPIRTGTTVQLGAERIKLAGAAVVKRMERYGSKYLLGLQLTQAILDKTIAELEGRPVVTVLIENLNRTY
jgi:hypothetical protein